MESGMRVGDESFVGLVVMLTGMFILGVIADWNLGAMFAYSLLIAGVRAKI